ncbi:hypothetical protein BV898_18144 [Hypsibius exemplaris]|uniref:Uncharacterized protein n=1 Tax=Hypsibius exemplaris TaxID=2072580 RepID=A0A9X6RN75_HYPEX|nr:hypothetical protein BV898_18144 [Hypsibius exemplaris]
MPKAKFFRAKAFIPSDQNRSNPMPQSFLNILKGLQEQEDIVVFEYGDDKVIELVLPSNLTTAKLRPRFTTELLESYAGKTRLEVGMPVRLFWSSHHDCCPAIVVGGSPDYQEMNALFKQLTAGHKTGNMVKKAPSKRKKSLRATINEKADERQKKRQKLTTDELSEVRAEMSEENFDISEQESENQDDSKELEDHGGEEMSPSLDQLRTDGNLTVMQEKDHAEYKRLRALQQPVIAKTKIGPDNIDKIYKHLVDFRHSKRADGSEGLIEMRSKSDLTKEWTKAFAGRIARLKKALHADQQVDETPTPTTDA